MKTMNLFLMAAALTTASFAQAATCETPDGVIRVLANDSVMVVSDTTIQYGKKTIARFNAEKTLDVIFLQNGATKYVANVDLRFSDSARGGEWILGTKLGELDEIQVVVADFDDEGAFPGSMTLVKRNGEKIRVSLSCSL